MMRPCWWVERPFDALLQAKFTDLPLIPIVNCFAQLLFATYKITTIIGSHLDRLASSCNKSSHCVNKRIRVQTECNLQMNGSYRHAGKQDSISLYMTSSSSHGERTKAMNAYESEGWFPRCNAIWGQVCHLLFSQPGLPLLSVETIDQISSNSQPSIEDPEFLSNQCKHMLQARMTRL